MIKREITYTEVEVFIEDEDLLELEKFLYNYLTKEKNIDLSKYYHLRRVYEDIATGLENKSVATCRSLYGSIDKVRKELNIGD